MDLEMYETMANHEKNHWWFKGRRHFVKFFASKYKVLEKDSLNILEVGCGTGGNIATWNSFASNVNLDLIEPEDYAREYLKETQDLDAVSLYLPYDEIPFPKKHYDLIIMLDVLEHIEDDAVTLKVLKEYLKDDGLLIIMVPAYKFLWSTNDDKTHHKRRYTKTDLTAKAKQAGYLIEKSTYVNTILFPGIASVVLLCKFFKKQIDNLAVSGGADDESFLNKLLYNIWIMEDKLLDNLDLPFGHSVATVLRNQSDDK